MITIDWATFIIHVPKADLTLIQLLPVEIRELNLNSFRLRLKDIEDDAEGIGFLKTHNHYPEISVGGVTLARVIQILDPYTITFEDGQYAVNLVGANSNVGDKVNVNQVSVRSANSAGLISNAAIEYASFNGGVTIDVDDGVAGTVYPIGTPLQPVNNLADALLIAEYRGFDRFDLMSNLTIDSSANVDSYTFVGNIWDIEVTVESGASLENTNFTSLSLYGVLGNYWNVLTDCWIYDITNFCGWVRGGSFESIVLGPYTVDNNGQSFFDDIVPMYPGVASTLTMNTDTHVSFTDCNDIVSIESLTVGSEIVCGLLEGQLILDSSCTGGNVMVTGVGLIEDNSTGVTIDTEGLVSKSLVAIAVHEEIGTEIEYASFGGCVTVDAINGTSGTVYPIGTSMSPVDNLTDAVIIATARGFKCLRFIGNYTFGATVLINNFQLYGEGMQKSVFTFEPGCIIAYCLLYNAHLVGRMTGMIGAEECHIDGLGSIGLVPSSQTIIANKCLIDGTITLPSNYSGVLKVLDCWSNTPGVNMPILDMGNSTADVLMRNYSGDIQFINCTNDISVEIDFVSGQLVLDDTVTAGSFVLRGIGTLIDSSTGTTIDTDGFISKDTISVNPDDVAIAVWDAQRDEHEEIGSFGAVSEWSGTGSSLDPDEVAAAVWDAPRDEHEEVGSFGAVSEWSGTGTGDPDSIAAAVWNALSASYGTPGTMGWLQNLLDNGIIRMPKIVPGT